MNKIIAQHYALAIALAATEQRYRELPSLRTSRKAQAIRRQIKAA